MTSRIETKEPAATAGAATPRGEDEAAAPPSRPRYPMTDAGNLLARQSLYVAVTIDQILDIEDQAVGIGVRKAMRLVAEAHHARTAALTSAEPTPTEGRPQDALTSSTPEKP